MGTQVDGLLFEVSHALVERVNVSWGAESGVPPGPLAECLGQVLFQVRDPSVEPQGAVVGGEQIRLQRGAGDGRCTSGTRGRLGFESVQLCEQVAVAIEEAAVGPGRAGDARDAEFGALRSAVRTCSRRRAESACRPSRSAAVRRLDVAGSVVMTGPAGWVGWAGLWADPGTQPGANGSP